LIEDYFTADYRTARGRFLRAAEAVGGRLFQYPVASETVEEPLSIDVAVIGPETGATVLVTSGLHGVEGFAGSAMQLALLDSLASDKHMASMRFVLVHSINPYGFSAIRRFDEDNIDLNRNYLLPDESYTGAPVGYCQLDSLLNPKSAPSRLEPFIAKAIWQRWRRGPAAVRSAVAGGQYEYPHGVFYGGSEAAQSTRIVQTHCAEWLDQASSVAHLDIHTGLGRFGHLTALVNSVEESESYQWFADALGESQVETQDGDTAYAVRGLFGEWMQRRFNDREFHSVVAEYGTYGNIRVLAAMRAENRAHFYARPESAAWRRAKRELQECFCPSDVQWRERVVASFLDSVIRVAARLRA